MDRHFNPGRCPTVTLKFPYAKLVHCSLFSNYNQQDATLFNYLFLKGSTYFWRFLHPSSAAHNCTFSFRYCQPVLLQAGIVDEMELTALVPSPDDGWRNRPKHVEPFRNK